MLYLYGTVAIQASPATYVTNGLPLTISAQGPPEGASLPLYGELNGVAGYVYVYDPVHQTVRIFEAPSSGPNPLVELSNGAAIPSGVSGDVISAEFTLNRVY